MLPAGAQPILDARLRGQKPADMVIVSLVGPQNDVSNPTVLCGSAEYDWRWVRGLEVMVYTRRNSPWRRIVEAISAQQPAYLGLYDVFLKKGMDVCRTLKKNALESDLAISEILANPRNWEVFLLPWIKWENEQYNKETQEPDDGAYQRHN